MKHLNKILALALALIMVLGLATSVSAAQITIDDDKVENAEYGAYKLLDAIDLGDGKFSYTVNEKYRTALQGIVGASATDEEIIAYIDAQDTADETRAFADAIYEKIKNLGVDYEAENNVFADVAQGYYLIVETETGSAEGFEEDTVSLVMLDTAGKTSVTVETKEELPKSDKKVKDSNDSTPETSDWQDSADHDIGDAVPFKITFTLPSDYAKYDHYFVGIHDVQADGLTYNNDMKVMVGDEEITGWFDDAITDCNKCTFHIACNDIVAAAEAAKVSLKGGDVITFTYTSTLNEDAEFGATGNPNEMTIEFSNDPYGDGTSETPKDKVIVFTYKVNVDKVTEGENGTNVPLSGAGFTLYKEVPSTAEDAQKGADIKEKLGDNIKADALADDKYYIVVSNTETDAEGDTFGFNGVDDGIYVLVETQVPAGYNAWDAVEFEIAADHEEDSDDPALISLTGGDLVTGEFKDTGIIATEIENNAGIELPSTGGIGTTIFYVVGGMLAVAAVVLLITKKRMASAE